MAGVPKCLEKGKRVTVVNNYGQRHPRVKGLQHRWEFNWRNWLIMTIGLFLILMTILVIGMWGVAGHIHIGHLFIAGFIFLVISALLALIDQLEE